MPASGALPEGRPSRTPPPNSRSKKVPLRSRAGCRSATILSRQLLASSEARMRWRSRLELPPPASWLRLRCKALEVALHLVDVGLERAAHLRADRQEGEAAARPAGAAARRRKLIFLRGDRAVVFPDLAGAAAAAQRRELGFELAADASTGHGRAGKQQQGAASRRHAKPGPVADTPHRSPGQSALPLQNRAPVCRGEVNLRFTIWQIRDGLGYPTPADQPGRTAPAPCARLRPPPAPSC